jgi:hypothetical protein
MQPLHSDKLESFTDFFKTTKCEIKVKVIGQKESTIWNSWIIRLELNYLEFENLGPLNINQVEWNDINPVEQVYIGRLTSPRQIDKTESIKNYLENKSIPYTLSNNFIRVINIFE